MFAYRVVYRKHRCKGAAGCNLVLRMIEKTTGGDIHIITADVQCTMFAETYGEKMASDSK